MYAINGMPKETSFLHQNQPEDVEVECFQKLIAYSYLLTVDMRESYESHNTLLLKSHARPHTSDIDIYRVVSPTPRSFFFFMDLGKNFSGFSQHSFVFLLKTHIILRMSKFVVLIFRTMRWTSIKSNEIKSVYQVIT